MTTRAMGWALAACLATTGATAAPIVFSGERSNITPGGVLGGRCGASVLTISFSPDAFVASGTSNLGSFEYTASHCIASPPPGNYTDGQFTWDFGDGTLEGTYAGVLTASGTPGQFSISETMAFTGGTGRFAGATGAASFAGILRFGGFGGGPASFGDGTFSGTLTLAAVPEPGTWALLLAGGSILTAMRLRRRNDA